MAYQQNTQFIDFMAPFAGAEAGRKENDNINRYKNNAVQYQTSTLQNRELMDSIRSNRQASDYLSTFFQNRDAAVKNGVSGADFLKAQHDVVLKDPNFQKFDAMTKSKILQEFQTQANKTAQELVSTNEEKQANDLLKYFGRTPALSNSSLAAKAGNAQGYVDARSAEIGQPVQIDMSDPVNTLSALIASNGNAGSAARTVRDLGLSDSATMLQLQLLQRMLSGQGAGTGAGTNIQVTSPIQPTMTADQNALLNWVDQGMKPNNFPGQSSVSNSNNNNTQVSPFTGSTGFNNVIDQAAVQNRQNQIFNGQTAEQLLTKLPPEEQQVLSNLITSAQRKEALANNPASYGDSSTYQPTYVQPTPQDATKVTADVVQNYIRQQAEQAQLAQQWQDYSDPMQTLIGGGDLDIAQGNYANSGELQELQNMMRILLDPQTDDATKYQAVDMMNKAISGNQNAYGGIFTPAIQDVVARRISANDLPTRLSDALRNHKPTAKK